MLRAICDDEAEQRQLTQRLLADYAEEYGVAAKVRMFPSGQELLNAVMEEGAFDL